MTCQRTAFLEKTQQRNTEEIAAPPTQAFAGQSWVRSAACDKLFFLTNTTTKKRRLAHVRLAALTSGVISSSPPARPLQFPAQAQPSVGVSRHVRFATDAILSHRRQLTIFRKPAAEQPVNCAWPAAYNATPNFFYSTNYSTAVGLVYVYARALLLTLPPLQKKKAYTNFK